MAKQLNVSATATSNYRKELCAMTQTFVQSANYAVNESYIPKVNKQSISIAGYTHAYLGSEAIMASTDLDMERPNDKPLCVLVQGGMLPQIIIQS